MTFYGESIGIQDSNILTGPKVWSDVYNGVEFFDDGLTSTWNVGDSFWVTFLYVNWLQTGDVIGALKWGLRCVGTATLDLADAHNVDWGYGPSTVSWNTLPSLAISEASMADVTFNASPSLMNTDLLVAGNDAIMLRVTVTSGSLTVDKARLQIEPVGGMPTGGHWSAWQVSDPAFASPILSAYLQDQYYESSMVSTFTVEAGNLGVLEADQYRLDGPDINPSTHHEGALQWTAGTAWETLRNGTPPALSALIYGVDYFQQNGYTPSDPDCYVQYESTAPNVLTGWDYTNIILNVAEYDPFNYVAPDTSGSAAFSLSYIFDGPVYTSGDTLTAWPVGTVFGSGDKTTAPATAFTFNPGVATSILILPQMTSTLPAIYLANNNAHFSPDSLRVIYQQPRYRQWIPSGTTVAHLRQKGAASGALRSASRATANRGASRARGLT